MKNIRINREFENVPKYILALSSSYKAYKVAWEINRKLGLNLSQDADYQHDSNKSFQVFSLVSDDTDSYIKLIANMSESGYLSSKYKTIDYFLALNEEFYQIRLKEIKLALMKSEFIKGVFEITPDRALNKMLRQFSELIAP